MGFFMLDSGSENICLLVCTASHIYMHCVAHLCALSNDCEEKARQTAPSRESYYFGVICFRRTWELPAWQIWTCLTEISQSTIPRFLHLFDIRPGRRGSVWIRAGLFSCQAACAKSCGKSEQADGEAGGPSK